MLVYVKKQGYYLNEFLICPQCKSKLTLNFVDKNKLFYECENHHQYKVIDGVISFNKREIKGELWSLYLENYDNYIVKYGDGNSNYKRGKPQDKTLRNEIEKYKPRIILDIASGDGNVVEYCMPYINMVYIECDCASIPFIDSCVDGVTSTKWFLKYAKQA